MESMFLVFGLLIGGAVGVFATALVNDKRYRDSAERRTQAYLRGVSAGYNDGIADGELIASGVWDGVERRVSGRVKVGNDNSGSQGAAVN